MASENETIGDIVDDLRNKACLSWICRRLKRDKELRTLADRIEAAHKREVAKLRESLSDAIELFCDTCADNDEETGRCKDKDGVCPCVAR